jgi:type IV secretion system protein VirB10
MDTGATTAATAATAAAAAVAAAIPATVPVVSALRTAPRAPVLLEGTVIPAVLLTAVNSDLPGMLVAQVTEDIWDSVHGRDLLVPKGTRLVGDYNADVRPGQQRVVAAFRRLILPNGSSVDLLGTQATDAQGRSGLQDQVDRHFLEMFGASFIVAGLASLVQRREAQPATVVVVPGNAPGVSSTLGSAAGSVLVETSRAILGRAQNIPPTLLIRQGHRFSLTVQRTFLLGPEDAGTLPDVTR